MGSYFSRETFTEPPVPKCAAHLLQIQYALQSQPEFNNLYIIHINTIADVSELECSVQFTYSSAETGITKNENRNVKFQKTPEGDYLVESVSPRLNELTEPRGVSTKDVLNYYSELRTYNNNWIKNAWKLKNAKYNPPLPLWTDQIFMKNIELYNTNFNIIIGKILPDKINTDEGITLFKKWIAPVPADPIPPKSNKILLPLPPSGSSSGSGSDNTASASAALATQSATALHNADSISNAITTYSNYGISQNNPNYDPPLEGDDYETVLIKLIKGFDISSSLTSNNETTSALNTIRDTVAGDSEPSEYNRRLIGRYLNKNDSLKKFNPPPSIRPANYSTPAPDAKYIPYTFNERQKYLLDYAPVDDISRETLRVNFCESLGFSGSDIGDCTAGDGCCAPLQTTPVYSGSLAEAFTAASANASGFSSNSSSAESAPTASASLKKCGRSGMQLSGRTYTISIPSPPINIDTSNRMFTYKMNRPTNGTCKPQPPPVQSPEEVYNSIRPTLLKELQTTIKNNKMFDLRCPGACLNN